jgi:Protein O-mannosyl-transferase TMEM260-like
MNSIWGNYRRWNNLTGWFIFIFSSIVYLLTREPTVSFWDCGEFILAAFKLQVGHPPGAPLFLMMGRIASLFAGSDTSKVAITINTFSALCSGFAIMFLFWTITHLARKIFIKGNELEAKHIPSIIGSGIVGALAYTFSDTFWFSAVEGELYALSSLIIAVVFWGMLKWEDEADKKYSGRWIILIAYIMGLGLGVHRLNLLIIPVLVFVYYFRKYEVTRNGLIKTTLLALVILWLMVFVLMPGVPEVAGWFELLLVNVLGLPYNSGLLFFMVILFGGMAFGIYWSLKTKRVILNYVMTSLVVIMIGYSSYAMIMIRSSARPPMNQNNPSDVFSLSYYINMKQYGSAPKFYGNYYDAPAVDVKKVIAGYNKVNGKYKPYYHPEYKYNKEFETLFPRMYSADPDHESAYKYWGKVVGRKYSTGSGKEALVIPTFGENLRYFFRYQIGFMYLRYFMWNFAGRQNDIQGNGNPIDGNWISGIKFLDELRLGKLDKIPADLKSNPGNNKYYLLPLIAGLLGMFWQYKKDKNGFWLVMTFFIMTGLAIIIYLNQYPNQPRERDYAYVGSFYAFAIWIGFGFMFIHEKLQKLIGNNLSLAVTFIALIAGVPVLMGAQNWDDHDRSGRYTARDIGADYLKSCAPNSILFTYGDNDSFPVWYNQDVEGVRTDIRVANLSYIQAGWYIEMMRQKAYNSDPMPLTLGPEKYIEGSREQLPVDNRVDKPVDLKDIVQFAGFDDQKYKIDISGRGDYVNYIPANKFIIDVDTARVLANGTVKPYFKNRLISPMIWEYTDADAFKGDLVIMDLLSTNKWVRPIYFSTTVPSTQYKGLEKFFIQEGLTYRIAPIRTDKPEPGEFGIIDPIVMYDNMMNKFSWGNAADPSVYLDENNRRMFSNFRRIFGSLGKELLITGDTIKAVEAVHRGLEIVPAKKMPYDFFTIGLAEVLIRAGKSDEGEKLLNGIIDYSKEYLDYAVSLRPEDRYGLDYPTGINMQGLLDIYNLSVKLKLTNISTTLEPVINNYYGRLYSAK